MFDAGMIHERSMERDYESGFQSVENEEAAEQEISDEIDRLIADPSMVSEALMEVGATTAYNNAEVQRALRSGPDAFGRVMLQLVMAYLRRIAERNLRRGLN